MYHQQRWTLEKIHGRLDLIRPLIHRRAELLPPFRYHELETPELPPLLGREVDDREWPEIAPNSYWGAWMTNFVLRTRFRVPPEWDRQDPIALHLPLGEAGDFSHPECLVFIDGTRFATCDRHHRELLLPPPFTDGKEHTLALHGWTGLGGAEQGEFFTKLFMHPCAVVQIDPILRELVNLARVAVETIPILGKDDPIHDRLLNALNDSFIRLETRVPGSDEFYDSVDPALETLKDGIAAAGNPLDVTIHASGHAHIDVAWLWTLAQTRQKAARTFTSVLRNMEQFPGYHFSQSQPQLYEFIRQDHPDLFKEIQEKVKAGRWEPMGGMWVEADCNLSGAESLARQFLLGRSYFREHFGPEAESPVLWLPDVFGYAWALPQLIRQAGLNYFMTTKIGWNQYNRLPYDTFLWQGLDGTRILTHFTTVRDLNSPWSSTYNSMANPVEALGAWQNFQQKELQADLLMAYGWGDGGGGPTREILENIEIMHDFPGLPKVVDDSVRGFFETIAPLAESKMMPVWDGELYLEYHRGTYTTQARNKRANRKSEILLHDAEFLAAAASLVDDAYRYPVSEFHEAWRTICLNQFHDIIPGSSITPVYEESQEQYAQLAQDVAVLRENALSALAGERMGLLVNPGPFASAEPVFLPGGLPARQAIILEGRELEIQEVEGGCLIDAGSMSGYHIQPLELKPASGAIRPVSETMPETTEHPVLENECLRVEFSPAGDITRIYDKTNLREVLPEGALANQFQAFEDRPLNFDAWDIDIYYDDKVYLAEPAGSIRRIEHGPLRQTIEIRRRILESPITQRISLRRGSARLDFETIIEWNERATLLKVAFPVEVLAPQATYEIQWGNVQRPTHRNTSWDWARFESCAHKWIDLSEGDYGVSLLNDCKYGHDVHGNVLRLTLLRGPGMPDPAADYGEHHFTYSLFPHAGTWDEATQAAAYALNDPTFAWLSGGRSNKGAHLCAPTHDELPLVKVSQPNVVVETIKGAEDGQGLIVRLYESQRKRGRVQLDFTQPVKQAWIANLLEENGETLKPDGSSIELDLRPYQIVTLRVLF